MDNLNARVAGEIRKDAVAQGLSVNRLAAVSGIKRSTLARRFAGAAFTTAELDLLADALGTLPSHWFQRAESASE